jgi:hypothetical protein
MARLESSTKPSQELTPQEQKRVIQMVARMALKRDVPSWVIWNALYRFTCEQVWQHLGPEIMEHARAAKAKKKGEE